MKTLLPWLAAGFSCRLGELAYGKKNIGRAALLPIEERGWVTT